MFYASRAVRFTRSRRAGCIDHPAEQTLQLAVFIRCFPAPAGTPLAAPQSPLRWYSVLPQCKQREPMVPRCKAFRLKQLVQGYLFQFLPDQSGYLVKHPLDLTGPWRSGTVRVQPLSGLRQRLK